MECLSTVIMHVDCRSSTILFPVKSSIVAIIPCLSTSSSDHHWTAVEMVIGKWTELAESGTRNMILGWWGL